VDADLSDAVSLTYDAFGRMVEQNRSGVYTPIAYSPASQELALMSGQTLQKAMVPLSGSALAVYNSSGLLYYAHPDMLGSIRLATTPSRTMYFDTAYAPFGETYASAGGANLDPAYTGLDNFGARYLASSMARFMTPDWSATAAPVPYAKLGDPQSLNLYAYVDNNPVSLTDPTGHYVCNGTKAQCQTVSDGLAQARTALRSQNLAKDQRAALKKVVSTFGKAGDEHDGVTISFGRTQSSKATADAHSYTGESGLLRTDITFNSKFFGSLNTIQVAGVLVHERSHGLDGIARGNMDPQIKKQEFATEMRAYNVESLVPKGLGVYYPGLWNPNWDPGSAEASRFIGVFRGAIASTSDWCNISGAPGC